MSDKTIILQGITLQEFRQILREELREETRGLAHKPIQESPDLMLSLEKLLDFLEEKTGERYSKKTIYNWVFHRQIPYLKHGRLYFRQSQIEAWLNNGRTL